MYKRTKILLVLLLLFLGLGSVIYNQYLIRKILEQERSSVELLAKGYQYLTLPVNEQAGTKLLQAISMLENYEAIPDSLTGLIASAESSISTSDFIYTEIILENRFRIPALVVDTDDNILFDRNISRIKELNTAEDSLQLVQSYKTLNNPIKITLDDGTKKVEQFVYYGESPTVQLLRYYPYAQIIVLTLLLGIGYTTYRSITRSEQSNLWVGMAKEAAHQLGTPISGLYGWVQLLKDEFAGNKQVLEITAEIESDVDRLAGVAERFGKIGSEQELTRTDIEPVMEKVLAYMENRLPRLGKKIEIRKDLQAGGEVLLNTELFQWAIENLIKNALDALPKNQKNSFIAVSTGTEGGKIFIDISDSGSGINIKPVKDIFKPGFSTKKRGWGLGLSLTKRIVEDYHNGQVFVLHTEPGNGTTIRILLKQA